MRLAEPLEQRRMLSGAALEVGGVEPGRVPPLDALAPAADAADVTGPRLVDFRILGSPLGVSGIRLEFDEPLAPGPARRADNYVFGGDFTRRDVGKDPLPNNNDGVLDSNEIGPTRFDEAPVDSAQYEVGSRFVTVRPDHPFRLSHLRTVYVRSGPAGPRDLSANLFDGDDDGQPGGMGVLLVRTTSGKGVTYFDGDRDRVRLRLRGTGTLYVLRRISVGGEGRRAGDAVQVWLNGRSTPRTVLSGTVTPSPRGGDGRTAIAEILRVEEARIDLLDDPVFQVGAVTP